jgi:hypothetical protein
VKVILSRKGFDSSVGGHANPVLPDGTMVSLPIPSPLDTLDYGAIRVANGTTCAELIAELGANASISACGAHLDPDLVRGARPRRRGWRPAFGQSGAAAGHLRNQGVGVGDLFLFYGWFRHTERRVNGRLRFARGDGVHAIYGYLEVGRVITPCTERLPAWLQDHPHALPNRRTRTNNTIYVASRAGMLRFDDALVLTKPGEKRSRWQLPKRLRDVAISYHDASAWRDGYFQSYPRAQEYVIDADENVVAWARSLIAISAPPPPIRSRRQESRASVSR